MIGRLVLGMAALAVYCAGNSMVKGSRFPTRSGMAKRTLAFKVVGWFGSDMAAETIDRIGGCMIENGWQPAV